MIKRVGGRRRQVSLRISRTADTIFPILLKLTHQTQGGGNVHNQYHITDLELDGLIAQLQAAKRKDLV